ncbi:MAG: hypothetical protein FJ399_06330 [Verrucomicrobia bacterium]|nr:hypothetical protein [Verrucomicrobiota bacterium]
MADSTTTVYFEHDETAAREVLRLAGEGQDAVLRFWGGKERIGSFIGTKIFLGETPEAYYRLTLNRAGGSALFRSVIVIDLTKAGQVLSLQDFIRHELAHSFLRRRLGYIRQHLTVPAWFDEGCAVDFGFRNPRLGCPLDDPPSVSSIAFRVPEDQLLAQEHGLTVARKFRSAAAATERSSDSLKKQLLLGSVGEHTRVPGLRGARRSPCAPFGGRDCRGARGRTAGGI